MTAINESTIASLVTTSPNLLKFDATAGIEDINELRVDLFPDSPKQFYDSIENIDTAKEKESSNDNNQDVDNSDLTDYIDTVVDIDTSTANVTQPFPGNEHCDKTVEKLRIRLPSESPHWSSCYSSSSESTSSAEEKKRKRYCRICLLRFRRRSELNKHLLSHVTLPEVSIERLNEGSKCWQFYQDVLKRQTNTASEENGGFRLNLKILSGANNFDVIPNALDEANRGKGTRILTAKEIKLSPSRSPSTNASPLDAMVALAEMTFPESSNQNYANEADKVHFECPTLEGLDQYNEEVNKEAAAQLLKQLLETPQMPQENEWAPSNEYISIDRLAHMCPVCHSNFADAVMLYEHKRITGHDFQNLFQQQQQAMSNRPFLRPRAQTHLAVYGQPQLHQMNPNQFAHHQQTQQGSVMSQQDHNIRYAIRYPMRPQMTTQRRTPPPLYRPNNQTNQPINMAPFMNMNPDMYNPMPGSNVMNGNTIMNSNTFSPNARISPLQRSSPQQRVSPLQRVSPHLPPPSPQQIATIPQQQQFNPQTMMRPPLNMMRPMRPGQPPQLAPRQPMFAMRRSPGVVMARSPLPMPQPNQSIMRPRLMGPPPKKIKVEDSNDCEVISMQPRSDGLPVIHSVQGGADAGTNSNETQKSNETYQLSEITLSVKGKEQSNKNPKEVANILTHRGITVTSSKSVEQKDKTPIENGNGSTESPTSAEAVQKIHLNSSVSIIQKKKPPTIDLSNDDDVVPVNPPLPVQKGTPCAVKDCPEMFFTQETLNRHMQTVHKAPQLRISRCRMCPAKFSSADGLYTHQKKVHRLFCNTTPSELGIPVVDLKNEVTRSKLLSLGISNYIPLTNLNKTDDGLFGLPIVSVQGALNSAVCNIDGLGADNILSIGPVRAVPRNPTLVRKPD